ncbi:MAG: M23 family metallopeptidase [Deltaproteobacteria bacterium]|jgi:murein DD-endopeptidase MepM/ murein hydrolase activator NlpD|nr:M23 family metallopeptidase [Deltaproteobacteria bacterium]
MASGNKNKSSRPYSKSNITGFRNIRSREAGFAKRLFRRIRRAFAVLGGLFGKPPASGVAGGGDGAPVNDSRENGIPEESNVLVPDETGEDDSSAETGDQGPEKSPPAFPGKRILVLGILGVALVVLGILVFPAVFRPETFKEPAPAAPLSRLTPLPPLPVELPRGLYTLEAESRAELVSDSVTVGPGENYRQGLAALNLSQSQITDFDGLTRRDESVGAASEGDVIKAFWGDPGKTAESLERVEIHRVGDTRPLVFLFDGSGLSASYDTKSNPIEQYRLHRGIVRDGFWEAGLEAGLKPEAITNLTDLLSSRTDFLTDVKSGDSFELLYLETVRDGKSIGEPALWMVKFLGGDGELGFYRFELPGGGADFFDSNFHSVGKNFIVSPLTYEGVSKAFPKTGARSVSKETLTGPGGPGAVYLAPAGAPVSAVAPGTVKFMGRRGTMGNLVVLEHDDGYFTSYAHLSRFAKGLEPGAVVKRGDPLGRVGMTGSAMVPRLVFRLGKGEEFLDPRTELARMEGERLPQEFEQKFTDSAAKLGNTLATLKKYDQ